jgi:hypothetical protein
MSAQELWKKRRYEAIASIGTTQFFGDVGGFTKGDNILGLKDISFKQTRINFNVGLRYKILNNLAVRLSLTYGLFHATDERGSNEGRGFEARTSFFEPLMLGEYYFIKSSKEESYLFDKNRPAQTGEIWSSLDVYAFTGIGGLSYFVKGNDKLVAMGMKKSGFSAVLPVGVGFKLLIRPDWDLGLEFGARYAFSDYLDGYTSQYSSSNDVYYFFNVTFIYRILTGENGLPAFLKK